MRKLIVVGALASVAVVPALGGAAPPDGGKRASDNRVVCVDYRGGEGELVLRSRPRTCTFVHRGQKPFGYNTVDMIRLKWKSWGNQRAKAKGKQVVNMVGPVPSRVTLKRPRGGCGERTVFTQAVFTDPESGEKTKLPLDSCT